MTEPYRVAKITSWHLCRFAVVYIRQSDPQQVVKHQESTALQYAFVSRALELGWPRERILVIDDDQGMSGQSAEGRLGFHRLLAEVALDHVGLILGREVSRLARSCKDWYQLLELCARFRTLLADADGVYDPADYNDRLLLGLKGTMSEAELHLLKQRLHDGVVNKARRGALFGPPPIGYIPSADGAPALDPDEHVQEVVRLIFDQFDRLGTAHAVLRYLVKHNILIPVRPVCGPDRGQLQWRRPNYATLLGLLHHPLYAGAYRWGYRRVDPRRQKPGRRGTGQQLHKPEDCLVLLKDHLPAYINWERFCANQQRLAANRAVANALGAPRQGAALVGGLLYCGHCGARMQVGYPRGSKGHCYACRRGFVKHGVPQCQRVNGRLVDELVAAQILEAVKPAALEASLAAVADVERERAALTRQWQLRIERSGYEADRAARQYQACEPENRLVARTLEGRWEEALRQQQQLQEEFARWQQQAPPQLSEQDRQAIRVLAADLPALWQAETTTAADRKRAARLLLERVTVTVDKKSERVDVQLHWLGGQVCQHQLYRPVGCHEQQADYPRLVQRLKQLCQQRLSHGQMAEQLNRAGFQPPRRMGRFSAAMVLRLLRRLGLRGPARHGSRAGLDADEYRPGELAQRLEVRRETVKRWMAAGWVNTRQDEQGHKIIWADADELARLRQLKQLPPSRANRARRSQLKKPKQRPTP